MQVGPDSQFAKDLDAKLKAMFRAEFETSLAGVLKEQVQPVLSKVLTRLCNRLVNKFCVRGGPPQLLSALQHTFEWLHEEAPLRTWLRAELTKHVDLSFVREV